MDQLEIEPSTLAIATFIVALLLSITIFAWQRSGSSLNRGSRKSTKAKSIGSSVALIGSSNSGKSALFAKLTTGAFPAHPTYSSMATNQAPLSLNVASATSRGTKSSAQTPTLIDCPGHSRLLAETHKHLDRNPRVVLVTLDATALATTKRDAAERLALALDHRVLPGMRVLVVATKADNPLAMPVSAVKNTLAEELHVLRLAQEAQLGTTNSQDTDDDDGLSDAGEGDNLAKQLRVRKKGAFAGRSESSGPKGNTKLTLDEVDVEVMSVSAKSGKGIDELMGEIQKAFGIE